MVDFGILLSFLSKIQPLENEVINFLNSNLQRVTYDKNEVLVARGKIPTELLFIEKGTMMAYRIKHGKHITTRFWIQEEMIFLPEGFCSQKPSTETIIAIENSTLITLSFTKLHQLHLKCPLTLELILELLNREIIYNKERSFDIITKSITERYGDFEGRYKKINQLVMASEISSYIGVSRQTFSTLKSR